MNNRQEQFAKIEFTAGELCKLPPVHVEFLVGSCLAINEINVIQKVLLLALNTRAEHRPISNEALREIAFAHAIIIQRNLMAKVFEYLKMVGDYKKRCERAEETSTQAFLDEAEAVTSKLKEGESYKLAEWYRNKVTYHYVAKELTSLMHNGDLGGDDTAYSVYLHERDGNSSYLLGEQVLFAKLSENGDSPVDRMNMLEEWVIGAVAKVMELHHYFCIQLFETYLPEKKLKAYPIMPEPHLVGQLEETCLPILWDLQSLDRVR